MRRPGAGPVVVAVLLAAALSACSASPPTASLPVTSPPAASPAGTLDPDAVLAGRSAEGGLCPAGLCSSAFIVHADGTWESRTGADVTGNGTLSAPTVRELVAATGTTGIPAAPAFTGTCPIAYDGQELTYAWTSPDGAAHRVSACDRAIPVDDPLVVAIGAAEREAAAQP